MKNKAKVLFYVPENDSMTILLGRRTSGGEEFWWIPGGSIESDENPFEAVIRELEEEIVPGPTIKAAVNFYSGSEKSPSFVTYTTENADYTVFFVPVKPRALNEEIKLVEEFDEMKWFNVEQLPENMSREFKYLKPYLSESAINQL